MTRLARIAIAVAAAVAASAPALTQPREAPPPERQVNMTQSAVPAAPADVESIDSVIAAAHAVISGAAGERRNWARMRSLFADGARLMNHSGREVWAGGVEDYIATSGRYIEDRGYFQREIGRTVEQYGDIAQVFSAFEGRVTRDGPVVLRGINSFQLVRSGGRWWIASQLHQSETRQNPIPDTYLNRTQD